MKWAVRQNCRAARRHAKQRQLTTVQHWLGHGSIQITGRYLHHLGDFADRAALDVLNNATLKMRSERAKQLSEPSRFGAGRGHRGAPDHGRGRGR
jgi:hypothetical protein